MNALAADGWPAGRTDGWPNGLMDGRMNGRMDRWTDERRNGLTNGRMDRWTDGRMTGEHIIKRHTYWSAALSPAPNQTMDARLMGVSLCSSRSLESSRCWPAACPSSETPGGRSVDRGTGRTSCAIYVRRVAEDRPPCGRPQLTARPVGRPNGRSVGRARPPPRPSSSDQSIRDNRELTILIICESAGRMERGREGCHVTHGRKERERERERPMRSPVLSII